MAGVGENIGINSDIARMNNEIEKEEVKINQLFYWKIILRSSQK